MWDKLRKGNSFDAHINELYDSIKHQKLYLEMRNETGLSQTAVELEFDDISMITDQIKNVDNNGVFEVDKSTPFRGLIKQMLIYPEFGPLTRRMLQMKIPDTAININKKSGNI
jgi:hypothetical protein